MRTIKAIVVDAQSLERESLSLLIEKNIPGCKVIARASNGNEAIQIVDSLEPDLVFMDMCMPDINGFDVLFKISKMINFIKVIITSDLTDSQIISKAFRAGANGYILKHTMQYELNNAVKTVMSGNTYLSPEIDY